MQAEFLTRAADLQELRKSGKQIASVGLLLNSMYIHMYTKIHVTKALVGASLNWPSMVIFSPFGQKVFTNLNAVKFPAI